MAENTHPANNNSLALIFFVIILSSYAIIRSVFRRYGFDTVECKKDFESKLDKEITGLEEEIQEKKKVCADINERDEY